MKVCFSLIFLFTVLLFPYSASGTEKVMPRPLYPVLAQSWENGPLVGENFSIPQGKCYGSEKELAFRKRLYRELQDPGLKCILIRELSQWENPDLGEIFFPIFLKEQDPLCRKALLDTMDKWSKKGIRIPTFPPELFRELAASSDPTVKASLFSLAFQGNWNVKWEELLPHIDWRKDTFAADLLFTNRRKVKGDKKAASDLLRKKREIPRQLLGFALLFDSVPAPDKEPVFREKLAGRDSLLYRLTLAKLLASSPCKAPQLLQLMSKDPSPAVKLTFAEYVVLDSPAKERILLGYLAKGNPLSLRIRSAQALADGTLPASLAGLLEAMLDEDPILRKNARFSLIKRDPPPAFRKRIAASTVRTPAAYREGAAFFAALPDREIAGAFLTKILQGDHHPEEMILSALTGLEKIADPALAPFAVKWSSSSSPAIRKSCAKALGKMKHKKAFPALKRLLLDKDSGVAAVAFVTLWQWQEFTAFLPEIQKILHSRDAERAPVRAGAIRCAAKLPELSRPLMRNILTLLREECIVVPMAPRSYDSDEVRLSALVLLMERKEPACAKHFRESLAKLENAGQNPEMEYNHSMKEFLRQVKEIKTGKKVTPSPVPDTSGIFSFTPLGK